MNNNNIDDFLYDPHIVDKISIGNWPKCEFDSTTLFSVQDPESQFVIRPLHINDYSKGFPKILSQLTDVGQVNEEDFRRTFLKMKRTPDTYYITVLEDKNTGDIIGSTTLLMEQKFVHECAKRGRIEDVVVSNKYRGKQFGKLLVVFAILLSKYLNNYKLSLDCKDQLAPFYESMGFQREPNNSNFMVIRFVSKL